MGSNNYVVVDPKNRNHNYIYLAVALFRRILIALVKPRIFTACSLAKLLVG